jgi:O-antigen/teichoic acid export membrane protein
MSATYRSYFQEAAKPCEIRGALKSNPYDAIHQNRFGAVWDRFRRGRSVLALIDQVMSSGANFATNIVLVRGLGLSEYGKYSIAFILLLYANSLQLSFVTSPMLSLAPLMPPEEKKEFVSGMMMVQLFAGLLVCLVFAAVGSVAHMFTPFYSLSSTYAFATCVGVYQLQDWLRRYYFLYNKGGLAIINDFISYVVQFILIFVLWHFGQLTLVRTFLVMTVTSVAAIMMGPITDGLWPSLTYLGGAWHRCKVLSRDLVIANQIRWIGIQGVLLIGTGIIGVSASGGIRATMNLAAPVTLVLNSLENVFPIRIAESIKSKGVMGAYQLTRNGLIGGTLFFTLILTPVAVFGKQILHFIYGPAMVAYYVPMLLQLVSMTLLIQERLWLFFYRGVQETKAVLWSCILCALLSMSSVYYFGNHFKAAGVLCSTLLGQAAIGVYSLLYWREHRERLISRYPSEAERSAGSYQ